MAVTTHFQPQFFGSGLRTVFAACSSYLSTLAFYSQRLGHKTCDWRSVVECHAAALSSATPGQIVNKHLPLPSSSIIWY